MQRGFSDDCLPPEAEYESRNALVAAINAWAAPRGYAFVTARSSKEKTSRGKTGKLTVTYACDRHCRPPDPTIERILNTSTRGTLCEFSVTAKESYDKTTWTLKHRQETRFSIHNHEPSWYISAHPALRVLDKIDGGIVDSLSNTGIAPRDIRTYMH